MFLAISGLPDATLGIVLLLLLLAPFSSNKSMYIQTYSWPNVQKVLLFSL
jgi:hypothetical protein